MNFEDIKGRGTIVERLQAAANAGRVSHAYIFEGDACSEKELIADCFIKALLCKEALGRGCGKCIICNKIEHRNHEDVFRAEKDGNSIKDEVVSEMQERLNTKPLGERNIAVVKDADTLTVRAQNRLLKTLEEPPEGVVIILLSENTENLIKTIVSRCVVIRIPHQDTEDRSEITVLAEGIARSLIERKPFYQIKREIEEVTRDKDSAYRFLDALENVYGRLGISQGKERALYPAPYIYNAVALIEEARRDLYRNVNTSYVIKNLIIKIGG